MQMIDTYVLRELVTFKEEGTLVKVAARLNVSQSAVTRSMRILEEDIGVPIFKRSKNRLILNQNGEIAVEYAKKILSMQKEMIETLREREKHSQAV